MNLPQTINTTNALAFSCYLPENNNIVANKINNSAINIQTADKPIDQFKNSIISIQDLTQAKYDESMAKNIIKCTNKAFRYERLNINKLKDSLEQGTTYIFIEEDNKIVSSLATTVATKIQRGNHQHEILTEQDLYIEAFASIKKGMGKYLIKKTEAWASAQGFNRIVLEVLGDANAFMHKYYTNLNYQATTTEAVPIKDTSITRYYKTILNQKE